MEKLTATNLAMMEQRKKKPRAPKPVLPSQEAERYYSGQLRGMVRLMAGELIRALEPELKRLKRDYIADAKPTLDGWTDDILAAIRGVSRRFSSSLFESQIQRVAASTISRAEADNAEDFRKSVNQAVGVDFQLITLPKGMQDYLEASTAENVNLIKSIPDEYFKNVETIVLGGMKDGLAPTAIAKQIQEQTGVSARRAKLIARDQVSQLNADLTEKRQAAAGIEFYKSEDAGDQRVSGAPGGKYPNAKISCYGIARQDIGYGPGIYKVGVGASWGGKTGLKPGKHHPLCRCIAIAMIPGVNYFPKDG
ncbi:phage head morphogenesis protein [Pseudomonas lactis]|nr:phage head morphogenesis protein [Pseudomonas lactis]